MAVSADTMTRDGSQRDVSVEAAAILLTLAMRETDRPVAELGSALSRISGVLAAAADEERLRGVVSQDIAVCIRTLQFHDRLIQQLAAVRNLLVSLADHAAVDVSGFGAHRWEELLRTLRERLSADSQHQVFDLLLRTGVVELDGLSSPESLEGSVELF